MGKHLLLAPTGSPIHRIPAGEPLRSATPHRPRATFPPASPASPYTYRPPCRTRLHWHPFALHCRCPQPGFLLWSQQVSCSGIGPKDYSNIMICRAARANPGKKEHHLWMKRDSAGSGQKALHLVQIVSKLPNEKDTIYGALDKWSAWETEFPVVAAAKALGILRKRNQWKRVIQVTKWLISKGQCMTMGTYDTLLVAFDMDGRVDEAESFWNTIMQTHTHSVSKLLFARMISLYDHHRMPEKILEVFADMEELGVKPDEDTVRRIGKAFQSLGKEDEQKEVYKRYGMKWKYIHFNGERVRVRTTYAACNK